MRTSLPSLTSGAMRRVSLMILGTSVGMGKALAAWAEGSRAQDVPLQLLAPVQGDAGSLGADGFGHLLQDLHHLQPLPAAGLRPLAGADAIEEVGGLDLEGLHLLQVGNQEVAVVVAVLEGGEIVVVGGHLHP